MICSRVIHCVDGLGSLVAGPGTCMCSVRMSGEGMSVCGGFQVPWSPGSRPRELGSPLEHNAVDASVTTEEGCLPLPPLPLLAHILCRRRKGGGRIGRAEGRGRPSRSQRKLQPVGVWARRSCLCTDAAGSCGWRDRCGVFSGLGNVDRILPNGYL